jgi:hypothetical protein
MADRGGMFDDWIAADPLAEPTKTVAKPPFDPSKPFTATAPRSPNAFDQFDPDEFLRTKPPFDPSQPFDTLPDAPWVKPTSGNSFDQFDPDAYLAKPSNLSSAEHLAAAVTDIPHEIYEAGKSALSSARATRSPASAAAARECPAPMPSPHPQANIVLIETDAIAQICCQFPFLQRTAMLDLI